MSWTGRILGALIGLFLLHGPIGAVIGFLIGYFFYDRPRNALNRGASLRSAFGIGSRAQRSAQSEQIIISTFSFMGFVSRGAGRVNEAHIQSAENLMSYMELDNDMRARCIEAFNYGKSEQFQAPEEAQKLKLAVGNNVTVFSYFLELQVNIAIADNYLDPGEYDRLMYIGQLFGVLPQTMKRLIEVRVMERQFAHFSENYRRQQQSQGGSYYGHYRDQQYQQQQQSGWQQSQYGGQQQSSYGGQQEEQSSYHGDSRNEFKSYTSELDQAYAILGVSKDTPFDEIKKAHRRLMHKYHPDRIASQGLPPEMAKLYTQKAQDIQAAYNLIREARGER